MAADGTLNYEVTADTKRFDGPLSSANSAIAGMGRGLAGLVGPALALAGVAGGISLIGKALGGAAEVERLGIAFEVMTGSAEKGKKLLDDIRQMGSATPYEFPALAEGGKTLLNFGIAAENVIPTLSMLGDVAGGDNEKMRSLSVVYGQIASTGRLMGQDLLQLINTGFNPLNVISQKTGESMADLKKRMEDGGISSAEVADAFRIATSEGGMFFGMMDKQAGTSLGLLSTLKDTINETFTTLGTPINDALKPLLQGAIDMVGQVGAGLQAAVAIGQAAMAQGKMGELLGELLKLGAMEGINFLIRSQFEALQSFGQGFTDVISLVGQDLAVVLRSVNQQFAGEMGNSFLQVANNLKSALSWAFSEATSLFEAATLAVVEKLMEALGKLPGFSDHKAKSFDSLLADRRKVNAPDMNMNTAPLDKAGAWIADRATETANTLKTYFEDTIAKGNVFDTSEIRKNIGTLAQSLAPAAAVDLLKPLKDMGKPIAEAAKEAAKVISGPVAATKDDPGNPEKQKKIRLFNLADSETRRAGRMSETDKGLAKFGGSRLDQFAASPTLASKAFAAASGATPAMTPPPRRGAAAKPQEKSAESQLLTVLKEIATNTNPLKRLASA